MNNELWSRILEFDLDSPPGEYGFSTRLAKEHYWTKAFTTQAILEYKKFMYLAAVSDFMVSPSGVVDIVWHQHLIHTQSYHDFCTLIGKQVQHVPSTHNKEDAEKFRQAKERTHKLYLNNFGEQPKTIWDYNGMYESLNLEKARFRLRTVINAGIVLALLLTIPFYFLLKPVYVQIDNPYFLNGYAILVASSLIALEIFNRHRLAKITSYFHPDSFVYHLEPLELVYLKTEKLSHVINGKMNQLINDEVIIVNADNSIQLSGNGSTDSIEQLQVVNTLHELSRPFYPALVKRLATKPIFTNTANCMDAFKKYMLKSKAFGKICYINFGVLIMLLMMVYQDGHRNAEREAGDCTYNCVNHLIALQYLLPVQAYQFLYTQYRPRSVHT